MVRLGVKTPSGTQTWLEKFPATTFDPLIGRFLSMEVSINSDIPNGWFIEENPMKMDDLGVLPFQESLICIY
jgi:hypothetical protein